jgi:type IV pilus assembly protein PilW
MRAGARTATTTEYSMFNATTSARASRQSGTPGTRSCAGFSLVELMVAITLGLLLTAGMIQLFSSSRLTFQTSDALARVQENGRFAMELIKRDLRSAGERGFCAGRLEIRNHLRDSCSGGGQDFFDPARAIVGWEFDGTGFGEDHTVSDSLDPSGAADSDWSSSAASGSSLPGLLSGRVVPGSDVLVVRSLEPIPGLTADAGPPPNNPNQASINLQGSHGLPDDSLVLVTNCTNGADLFQNRSNANASTFSAGTGSCSNPGPGNDNSVDWSTSYNDSMQAFRVAVVGYYVGVRTDGSGNPIAGPDGNPVTGLYRLDMSNGTNPAQEEELVEGAESMQILYGFSRAAPDGDGQSVNDWLTADQVPADGWEQVIAVRIGIAMRSSEAADNDPVTEVYEVAGTDLTFPGDGKLRVPFMSTIALRNRVLVL